MMSLKDIIGEVRANRGIDARLLVLSLRLAQKTLDVPVLGFLGRAVHRCICLVLRVDLSPRTEIGPGLRIFHPFCIAIHPQVRIGRDCVLRHGVTIGNRDVDASGVPRIGDGVEFGCYAVVVGPIVVPDGTRLRALAVYSGNAS